MKHIKDHLSLEKGLYSGELWVSCDLCGKRNRRQKKVHGVDV